MKKILIPLCIALVCASTDMLAQTSTKDRLKEIEEMTVNARKKRAAKRDKLFSCDLISHYYFGYHQVSGQKELEGKFFQSHEVGFNTIQLGLHPASWVSLEAGLDLKWDQFELAKDEAAFISDHQYLFTTLSGLFGTGVVDGVSDFNQRIRTFALAVPVTLGFHAPWFSVRGGAEFDFNIDRYTSLKSNYVLNKNEEYRVSDKSAKVRNLLINYQASVDFDGIGVYFKYYPKPIFRDNGIASVEKSEMKYWTLGIMLIF